MQYFELSTQLLMWSVLLPLLLSNVAHMVLVKKEGLSSWSIPLSTKWFGPNKTYRGLLFVPMANALLFVLLQLVGGWWWEWPSPTASSPALELLGIGALYGLAYVLFELPNSWLKRRLGIAAGQSSRKFAPFFLLLDKSDSALGVSLVFVLINGEKIGFWPFFITSVLLHASISALLLLLKIKKSF
jgi:hypothetical protein